MTYEGGEKQIRRTGIEREGEEGRNKEKNRRKYGMKYERKTTKKKEVKQGPEEWDAGKEWREDGGKK